MDFKIDIGNNKITSDIAKKIKQLNAVPQQAFVFFVAQTPVRTGNARRHTHLNKQTIHAEYPYAERLDHGYSRQAPSGMTRPTSRFIKKTVDNIIRKK